MASKKSTPGREAQVSASKNTAVKKAPTKRVQFISPRIPSIHDLNPLRKLIELLTYQCYKGQSTFNYHPKNEQPKPVKVTKAALGNRISTKDRIKVKQYISEYIMHHLHLDQKIMSWDYLATCGLPDSIDLAYDRIPQLVFNITFTFQQRLIIEVLTSIGYPVRQIVLAIKKEKDILPLGEEEVEIYQYFYWNLKCKDHAHYPLQMLGRKIVQLDFDLRNKNAIGYHKQHNINLPDTFPERPIKSRDGELRNDVQKYICAPYLHSTKRENFVMWEEFCWDETILPFSSYLHSIKIGMGNTRINAVCLDLGVPVPGGESIGQTLTYIIKHGSAAVKEDLINRENKKAADMAKGVVLPIATVAAMLKVPIDVEADDLGDRFDAKSISQKEFGKPKQVDAHKPLPGLKETKNGNTKQ